MFLTKTNFSVLNIFFNWFKASHHIRNHNNNVLQCDFASSLFLIMFFFMFLYKWQAFPNLPYFSVTFQTYHMCPDSQSTQSDLYSSSIMPSKSSPLFPGSSVGLPPSSNSPAMRSSSVLAS